MRLLLVAIAKACVPLLVHGQCPQPHLLPGTGPNHIEGGLDRVVEFDDGSGLKAYAAGATVMAGTAAPGVARFDGTSWEAFGGTYWGLVVDIAVYGGSLYAAGKTAGTEQPVCARWTGSGWQPILGVGAASYFEQIMVSNNRLVMVYITSTAGDPIRSIRTYNGSTIGSIPFNPAGIGFQRIGAMTTFQGDLIMSGQFQWLGPTVVNNISRWDGTAWRAMGAAAAPGVNYQPDDVAVFANKLYVSGSFTSAGGTPITGICLLGWDGLVRCAGHHRDREPGDFRVQVVHRQLRSDDADL